MLSRSCRRGVTLPEVMLALVVTLLVMAAIHKLLLATQRASRAQAGRVALQSSVRAGALVVLDELSELGTLTGGAPEQNDILAMGRTATTYRAMRGTGFVCQAPSASVIRVARSTFSGHRDPQPLRDQVYILVPGNPAAGVLDSWAPAAIGSVATATCPGGQGEALTLTLSGSPLPSPPAPGTPVRITELMELRLYRADDQSWLGLRSVAAGEGIQPLVGPLADEGGFALEYLDDTGAATVDRTDIRAIRVTLRGVLDQGGGPGASVQEELITLVPLRNSPAL